MPQYHGKNQSAIGLATATKIDPSAPAANWVDQGPVIQSQTSDDFNAIDPMVFTDADGRSWMVFGSFWSGIKLIRLDPTTGLRLAGDPAPRTLAARAAPNAIEGPAIIRHGGYYYLFVSFDACCQGAKSTYNTVVGRATAPASPPTSPASAHVMASGHQSRLASASSAGSVLTDAQALRSRCSTAAGTGTWRAGRWGRTRAGSTANSIGITGARPRAAPPPPVRRRGRLGTR